MSIKYMDIKEFREIGLLQEVNRKFFHPMGLALEVQIDEETGEEKLGRVWDYRDDPEGMNFGWDDIDTNHREAARKKAEVVEELFTSKKEEREEKLGYFIQPVPTRSLVFPNGN